MKRVESNKGGNVLENIKKLEQQREDRRRAYEEAKQAKQDRKARNEAAGKVVDCDYDEMIDDKRQ